MENRFCFRRKAASCSLRSAVLEAVLPLSSAGVATPNKKRNTIELDYPWADKQDDNLAAGRVVFDTRVFPQIIGKFAPLQDHALFLVERVTRSRLAPVYS
jgi:hypothetical protein